ncbi:MAG: prepilin-type N-terminal cleavage/methylation domain-containing protein, partial [Puniceicoccales bacterium]
HSTLLFMAFPRNSSRSAFTLVELLVVLGVMAIFVGVFATALRPGSPTVAVEGAQSQLASLLTQARGVAVLKNSPARLIIHNDISDSERYLRYVGIVYWNDEDSEWEPATDGITLPQGVYAYVDGAANMEQGFSLEYISNDSASYAFIEFNENGTVSPISGDSPRIAVSSADPNMDGTGALISVTRNENNIRGAILRQYGSFVLLNEPSAFPST